MNRIYLISRILREGRVIMVMVILLRKLTSPNAGTAVIIISTVPTCITTRNPLSSFSNTLPMKSPRAPPTGKKHTKIQFIRKLISQALGTPVPPTRELPMKYIIHTKDV